MARQLRVRVWGARAEVEQNRVVFTTTIERATDETLTTWDPLFSGNRELQVSADAILTITEDPVLTLAQKQVAVIDLLMAEVAKLNLSDADEALQGVENLLPEGGWPVNLNLP